MDLFSGEARLVSPLTGLTLKIFNIPRVPLRSTLGSIILPPTGLDYRGHNFFQFPEVNFVVDKSFNLS